LLDGKNLSLTVQHFTFLPILEVSVPASGQAYRNGAKVHVVMSVRRFVNIIMAEDRAVRIELFTA